MLAAQSSRWRPPNLGHAERLLSRTIDVRGRLVRHLQALGPTYLHSRHSGELAVTAVDGIEAIEPYYARYLPQMAVVSLMPLAFLACVFPQDWISGLVLLVSAPVIPLFMI